MSNELSNIPIERSYTESQIDLIKRMFCVGASDDELQLFLYTAKRTGLDPLARQIHMVKRWNSQQRREVAAIQTGIDGYRLIADRTGNLAGITDAVYDSEDGPHPNKATITVTKLLPDGTRAEFTATARWSEYVQLNKEGKPNAMWTKMAYLMLAKCAEALALRKAFPADLSGIYTNEEMGQADSETHAPVTLEASAKGDIPSKPFGTIPPDKLHCIIVDVLEKETPKKKAYLQVILNGTLEDGKNFATCFDLALMDALAGAKDKECILQIKPGEKFTNILDVLLVDGVAFSSGKPMIEGEVTA